MIRFDTLILLLDNYVYKKSKQKHTLKKQRLTKLKTYPNLCR